MIKKNSDNNELQKVPTPNTKSYHETFEKKGDLLKCW